jgi:hypothetical protein
MGNSFIKMKLSGTLETAFTDFYPIASLEAYYN